MTSFRVCEDDACVTQYDSNSLRISDFELEVNLNIGIRPTTVYLESTTISGHTKIEAIAIKVCGYETLTVDQTPFTAEYEVYRGD